MKFRKKPIIIEAIQWFKNGDHPQDYCYTFRSNDGTFFIGEVQVVRYYRHSGVDGQSKCSNCDDIMYNHGWINTVQGGHTVCPGDWIITDDRVKDNNHGHYYPCKKDIFEATYEPVEMDTSQPPPEYLNPDGQQGKKK